MYSAEPNADGHPIKSDKQTEITVEYLSPKEFGRHTHLSDATVRRRIKDGTLPFVQLGGRRHSILIRSDALKKLQKSAENITGSGAPPTRSNRLSGPKPKWQM